MSIKPSQYKILRPFKAWVQQTLPAIYDDSLSYTDLLAKMLVYINSLVENNNALSTDMKNAIDYINNFFDNLDVQDEINKKLDKMAEDGTLSRLIQPLFDEYKTEINAIVAEQNNKINQLSVYVTPEMFGAVGDGVTDDYNAFISALTSDKPIKLGTKTYYISRQLEINNGCIICGDGSDKSILKIPNGLKFKSRKNYISHLSLIGDSISDSVGVYMGENTRINHWNYLFDMVISSYDTGIKSEYGWDNTIEKVRIQHCKIGCDFNRGFNYNCNGIYFDRCDLDINTFGARICFINSNFGITSHCLITEQSSIVYINCNFECDSVITGNINIFDIRSFTTLFISCQIIVKIGDLNTRVFAGSGSPKVTFIQCRLDDNSDEPYKNLIWNQSKPLGVSYSVGTVKFIQCYHMEKPNYSSSNFYFAVQDYDAPNNLMTAFASDSIENAYISSGNLQPGFMFYNTKLAKIRLFNGSSFVTVE